MSSVFVVEDNRMLRTMYVAGLSGYGYEVTETETVEGAKEFLATNQPDAILLDMQLPDGTGEDVIRHVRQNLGRDTRIVVGTGNAVDEQHLVTLGANVILYKPIDFSILVEALGQ